jgi:HPt (histidine-containing phosphotransfer) domain-containing protein
MNGPSPAEASATDGCVPSSESKAASATKSGVLAFDLLETHLGRDTALEVLNSFLYFARASIEELQHLALARNAEQSRSITAELGNSCRVIGASSLLRSCILLEEELREPDWVRIGQYIEALAAETKTVSKNLRQLLVS